MKTLTVHSLTFDTRDIQETEVYATEAELHRRLREIMLDRLGEVEGIKEKWAKDCRARWRKRLKKPAQTWRHWKSFTREEGISALRHPEDFYSIGDHDIEIPAEIQNALQSADCSLVNYHRHLWHSDKRTRGGLEREGVVKTLKAIRKILGTNTPGQEL